MKRWGLCIGLLLMAALVGGCSTGAAEELPTVAPVAAVSATPAATATSQPPTLTATPEASPTSAPTQTSTATPSATPSPTITETPSPTATPLHPLMIEVMRQGEYPGSDIVIEQVLQPGSNYQRYLASYLSEGLKIYALLTVPNGTGPNGEKPATGWPAVIFNHGYIPPAQYRTTERYIAYVDAFARSGYIVFRPDYRGHGNSEGEAEGGYGSPGYTIDVLNATGAVKRYADADPDRIGSWGHSMGGHITLRAMVSTPDIKAGVIWAGVIAPYPDMMNNWRRPSSAPPINIPERQRRWRQELTETYGTPEENPAFWETISPASYLADLSGPVQLHHGTRDVEVPVEFSRNVYQQAQDEGISMPVEYYEYAGDNHNLSNNLGLALQRSVEFFDRYVKNAGG
jgi:uncharacterized protein